jgi:hypothetical protein
MSSRSAWATKQLSQKEKKKKKEKGKRKKWAKKR